MAQDERPGAITGVVTDTSGAPMPSVTIVLLKADGTAPSQTETDERGRYRLADVSAGNYTVTASAPAFAPVRRAGIHVGGGAEVTVDVRLAIAPFSQTLSVAAGPLVYERPTPASPATIDAGLLQHLPSNRSIPNLINLVPGIVNDSAYGGTTRSNRLTVSGVDITSPAAGEVSAVLDMNWIRDVQVIGLGAGAEHGQTTGVTADVALKSGSDRVSALAEYRTAMPGLTGRNTGGLPPDLQSSFAPLDILHAHDGQRTGGRSARARPSVVVPGLAGSRTTGVCRKLPGTGAAHRPA